ncbi:unnamed protein product [Meganyctiphanes norvegica]|uniref:MBD domain-containing protein n=1 Tax=Meganyctiphanes norvegica TaxID=48144 RepID=A0AAV2SFT2_MEGNR
MHTLGYNECDTDEFECSECDFKCSSEMDIIKHSDTHQYCNNAIAGTLTNIPNCDNIQNDFKEFETADNFMTKFNYENEKETSKILKDTTEICDNDLNTYIPVVKREPCSFENVYTDDTYHKSGIGNKKLKVENLEIEHNDIPYVSPLQINQHDNFHSVQNSLDLIQSNNKINYGKDKPQPVHNKLNIGTINGILDTKNNVDVSGSLSCQNEPPQNDLNSSGRDHSFLTKKSYNIRKKIKPILDNTGIYIPEGWQRILKRMKKTKGMRAHAINYITPDGKVLCDKAMVYSYLSHSNRIKDKYVDVEKMNFSLKRPRTRMPVLDNTGIYIPEGWQRKLHIKNNVTQKHSIYYVSPDGKRINGKCHLYKYFSHLNREKEKCVDVEKLNFYSGIQSSSTNKCHSNPKKGKYIEYLFDVRKMRFKSQCYILYLCKLCSNTARGKGNAYSHIEEHIEKLSHELSPNNTLQNKYDYFVCTDCHGKIMVKNEIQAHLLSHNSKQISSIVIGVRYYCDKYVDSERTKILHYCEVCDFCCYRYIDIYKHLKLHTPDEIDASDRDKYSTYTNESNKNTFKYFNKYSSLGSEEQIHNHDIPINKNQYSGPSAEVDVHNTGKYIPRGWQRKLCQYRKGRFSGQYVVRYISPFGKTLCCKAQIPEYMEWLESNGISESLHVELFDFSKLPKTKRRKKRHSK